MVVPGLPQLNLWPDAVVAVGDVPSMLPRLGPTQRSAPAADLATKGIGSSAAA